MAGTDIASWRRCSAHTFPAQTNLPGTTEMLSSHGCLRLPELNGMSNGVFDSWLEMSANTTVVDTGYDFSMFSNGFCESLKWGFDLSLIHI